MKMQFVKIKLLILAAMFGCFSIAGTAQTTFYTYQGRLIDATMPQPTNGTYEMQFRLYNAAQNGAQVGSAQTIPTVQVVGGIFTVQLDAESSFNTGADLYIEISVRPAGSQVAPTKLSPRQQVTSAPYAVQSRNALTADSAVDSGKLGGIPASSYTQNNDVRLADDRNPTAGSANYVQNQNSTAQLSANFNISGSGKADIFDAATQFNIGGNRVFSVKGNGNVFGGVSAGTNNGAGIGNTFVGFFAGNANTAGTFNSFYGVDAGRNNQADANSFFGRSSGLANIDGTSNAFFGLDSGRFNISGNGNAFFGRLSGYNSKADNNAFFGFQSGFNTNTGGGNAFFGFNAGLSNTIGTNNTIIGSGANVGANNLNFATAIGAGSVVSTSNTVVLGRTTDTVVAPNLLQVGALGAIGTTALCRNATNQIAACAAGSGTSGDYIQNQQTSPQSADFSISGSGRVGGFFSAAVVSTETFYRIGTQIVFNTPNATSVAVGLSSGFNATGSGNAFFGTQSGSTATTGAHNSYFGFQAGQAGGATDNNAFFGYQAGKSNGGTSNTFVGSQAGSNSVSGSDNTFVGRSSGAAGESNTAVGSGAKGTGDANTVVGAFAGGTGSDNAFFGTGTGGTGSSNTFIGRGAGGDGDANTLIGTGARVTQFSSSSPNPSFSTAIGAGAVVKFSHTIVLGTSAEDVEISGNARVGGQTSSSEMVTGSLRVTGGSVELTTTRNATKNGNKHLCLNGNHYISICPEDDFKTASPASDEIQPEQTNQIETQAAQIKAQQMIIEKQAEQFKQQQAEIDALKKLVCASNPTAGVCRQQ